MRCLIVAMFQQQPAARAQMCSGVCDDVAQPITVGGQDDEAELDTRLIEVRKPGFSMGRCN